MEIKKVLSFDPGIHNLAWSICEKTNDAVHVIKFGLFDLDARKPCQGCGKVSGYFRWSDLTMIYCCKEHKNDMENFKKINNKSPSEYADTIIEKFDIFNDEEFDIVIVENTPSFKNPKVKTIQNLILMYFRMKNKVVIFQNPVLKTFGHVFEKKNKYRNTKKFAITLIKELLPPKTISLIKINSKIDDIADAVLTGTAFIYNKKPPPKINHLIKTKDKEKEKENKNISFNNIDAKTRKPTKRKTDTIRRSRTPPGS